LVLHCAVFEKPADHILEAVELVKTGKAADLAFEEQA